MSVYEIKFLNSDESLSVIPQIKQVNHLNEELDMYEFTLSTLDHRLDLDLSKYNGLIAMELYVDYTKYAFMYLTYFKETIVSYDPLKYKYVIQAASPNIKLQRITLPNKLITQPIGNNKRSLWTELNKIMEVYASDIVINQELEQLMSMPCPEMQFVKSTLYEVLVALFAVANLVPKMQDGKYLSYMSLIFNEDINKSWDSEKIFIRAEMSNQLANYADGLDFDIENAISKDKDQWTKWLAPTSSEAMITDENFYWELPNDIYSLSRVWVSGDNIEIKTETNDSWTPLTGETIDITNQVVPKVVYDTLKTSSKVVENGLEYKRNNLYYEGNKIDGATYIESNWLPGTFRAAIVHVLTVALAGQLPSSITELRINDFRKTLIQTQYKTESNNSRVKIIRNDVSKPVNFMISNQDDSYIDIVNFGKQKQDLINRLGNNTILAQANFRYDNLPYGVTSIFDIPNVGDRVDNKYIISDRELLIQENTALANYTLTKNYVLRTGYSGLKQLKRFTSIDTERTVIRNDNFLYNFELDFEKDPVDDELINLFINHYGQSSENGITMHECQTILPANAEDGTPDFNSLVFIMSSQNKVIANSVICQIQFPTSFKVGDYIDDSQNRAFQKVPVRYVNDNGEFKYLNIKFGGGESQRNRTEWDYVKSYPLTPTQLITNPKQYLINKDNREITSITFQFRLLGDTQNIFVYNDFAKYSQLTAQQGTTFKIYVTYTNDPDIFAYDRYDNFSTEAIGNVDENANIVFGTNVNPSAREFYIDNYESMSDLNGQPITSEQAKDTIVINRLTDTNGDTYGWSELHKNDIINNNSTYQKSYVVGDRFLINQEMGIAAGVYLHKKVNENRAIEISSDFTRNGYYAIGVVDRTGNLILGINYVKDSSKDNNSLVLWLNKK